MSNSKLVWVKGSDGRWTQRAANKPSVSEVAAKKAADALLSRAFFEELTSDARTMAALQKLLGGVR